MHYKNRKRREKAKSFAEPFFHLTKLYLLLYYVSHISMADMKIFEQPIDQEREKEMA